MLRILRSLQLPDRTNVWRVVRLEVVSFLLWEAATALRTEGSSNCRSFSTQSQNGSQEQKESMASKTFRPFFFLRLNIIVLFLLSLLLPGSNSLKHRRRCLGKGGEFSHYSHSAAHLLNRKKIYLPFLLCIFHKQLLVDHREGIHPAPPIDHVQILEIRVDKSAISRVWAHLSSLSTHPSEATIHVWH